MIDFKFGTETADVRGSKSNFIIVDEICTTLAEMLMSEPIQDIVWSNATDELDEVAQADLQLPDPDDDETLIALGFNITLPAKPSQSAEKE